MTYTVILSPQPDPAGGYTAIIPGLRGVVSEGDTRAEALANVVEAATLWLEDALAQGELIPREDPRAVAVGVQEVIEDREAEGWPIAMELVTVAIPIRAREAA